MLRVLTEDGFLVVPIDPASPNAVKRIEKHLAERQLVLAAMDLRAYLHWVLLVDQDEEDQIRYMDPLGGRMRRAPAGWFFGQDSLVLLPVKPDPKGDGYGRLDKYKGVKATAIGGKRALK